MIKEIKGNIHSIETFGAVDGPGLRFIVFLQGCPLRCLYCHNPDSWKFQDGKEVTSDYIINEILKYKNFIKNGGVTLSGGEPLMQPEFVEDIITKCKENSLHTAIDTSGVIPLESSKLAIDKADMLLLDIKDIDEQDCIDITGKSNVNCIKTLDYCEKIKKPVWIRHVIVPGYTLDYDKLQRLRNFLDKYSCIEKIEPLPFHKIGEYKWEQLKLQYKLSDVREPLESEMQKVYEILAC